MVGGPLQDMLKTQSNLGPSEASEAAKLSGESLMEGLKDNISSGNTSEMISMFTQKEDVSNSHPMVSGMIANLSGKVANQLGVSTGVASNVANMAIPFVINLISSKFRNSEHSQDASGLMSMIAGGSGGGGIIDQAKGLLGGLFGK
ncbi:hypothetical protein PEPS_38070 (plasmid) [Persicobacter psychrovividus]|uniref:DUF937 domain-containing protein n=2 Tax=Persicobacter psychrovividus TaxID=387638 RepID=A0ABM7VKI9_9BACT|nr:hypothetical protein PEPS_38070 [Persicobacter psychrovividus]